MDFPFGFETVRCYLPSGERFGGTVPIIDVEIVCGSNHVLPPATAGSLATALGKVFESPPGRTWVRLRTLDASCYAENECAIDADDLPVFVTVTHARPPVGAALQAEITAATQAVAACFARNPEQVHVAYAPAAAGRQAFGGHLVE